MFILRYFNALFLFLTCLAATNAQNTFNISAHLGWPANHFRDMILDNDTIIGYGLAYPDNTYSQQGLILSKFDSSGNHLFSRMLLDPLGEHLSISQNWGKIAKTRDGGYIMPPPPPTAMLPGSSR